MATGLILAAALLAGLSGFPALVRKPRNGGRGVSPETLVMAAASVSGLVGTVLSLVPASRGAVVPVPWWIPGGPFTTMVDPLSALFLGPLFLVAGLGAVFGDSYWSEASQPSWRRLRVFYGLMTGAIAVVLVARNTLLFLAAWEVMALAAFFLISTEWSDTKARRAGLLFLMATHVGTLLLFGLFALMYRASGSFALAAFPAGLAASSTGIAIFWLAVAGFGLKAGLMPLHFWLPPAHAAAPSHVSALMSGVLIKTGIYALVRVLSLFPDPPLFWGESILALGVVSGVLGVAFALGQHDLKRLLAYHSVENIGIIAMGIGLGLVGRSTGNPEWVVLGYGGGLLHVVNHGLFKPLLFLGAGSVVHATGTREMDRMGGLLKILPLTGAGFLVGAVAICGLPPLNGFVSEWFVYLGLLRTIGRSAGSSWVWGSFAVPALALIGSLALACFVKAFGIVFLGTPRGKAVEHAGEPSGMVAPMMVLAALCALIGLVPLLLPPFLDQAIAAANPEIGLSRFPSLSDVAALGHLTLFVMGFAILVGALALVARGASRGARAAETWGCGYLAPGPTMQYTSSSFASWTVGLFKWALLPLAPAPKLTWPFPKPVRFETRISDAVLDRFLVPLFRTGTRLATWGRWFQQGRIQIYLVYVLLIIVILLFRV